MFGRRERCFPLLTSPMEEFHPQPERSPQLDMRYHFSDDCFIPRKCKERHFERSRNSFRACPTNRMAPYRAPSLRRTFIYSSKAAAFYLPSLSPNAPIDRAIPQRVQILKPFIEFLVAPLSSHARFNQLYLSLSCRDRARCSFSLSRVPPTRFFKDRGTLRGFA